MTFIAAISDSHLGFRHRSKVQRLKDYRKSFNEALGKALALDPGVVVFGGDLLHHPKPDPVSMRAVVQGLLKAAQKTQVVVCIGNHEIAGHLGTTYAPIYSDLHRNIHVLSTESPHIQLKVNGKTVGFHGFQYIRGREVAEKTLLDVSRDLGENEFNVLCIHQAVEKYLAPHEISLACLREVAPKYSLMLVGHVHKHQRIQEVSDLCPAYYIGSTERISFNECENKTGFMAFEENGFANPRFVEVDSARMRQVSEDLGAKTPAEINAFIESRIRENEGVKLLQLNIEAEVLGDFLDVKKDWSDVSSNHTILDVNLKARDDSLDVALASLDVSSDTIREYFEKTSLSGQQELLSACIELFEEYGR